MLKMYAHDTVNDIALIETAFCFNVRYGLEVTPFDDFEEALENFGYCQRHALSEHLND